MLVPREAYAAQLRAHLRTFPAVAVLGPRQCGKSTLVRAVLQGPAPRGAVSFFDLERPADLSRLASPSVEEDLDELQSAPGLVCIDEIQRLPPLFPLLRVLLDRPGRRARYVVLGSASPSLVRGASESVAGRLGFLDLTPFVVPEVDAARGARRRRLWVRGGLPPSFLARSERASVEWRESYVRTFLERDIPALGLRLPALVLRRFWTMLAHVHGGIVNASELAAGLGVSVPTVGRYLDLLEGAYMIRRLPPYWANVGKRLTKSPKVYLRDSGLLHTLLGVASLDALRSHPKVGASWEGWVIEQAVAALRLAGESVVPHFWRTHGGAEVDLVLALRGRAVPVEIKLGGEPRPTRGLLACMTDLGAPRGFVLHGGEASYPLGDRVDALSVELLGDPVALAGALLDAGRRPGRRSGARPRTRRQRPRGGRRGTPR